MTNKPFEEAFKRLLKAAMAQPNPTNELKLAVEMSKSVSLKLRKRLTLAERLMEVYEDED